MYLEYPKTSDSSDEQRHHCRVTGIKYIVVSNKSIYALFDRNGHTHGGKDGDGEILFDETARTPGMKVERMKCPACGDWV